MDYHAFQMFDLEQINYRQELSEGYHDLLLMKYMESSVKYSEVQ